MLVTDNRKYETLTEATVCKIQRNKMAAVTKFSLAFDLTAIASHCS